MRKRFATVSAVIEPLESRRLLSAGDPDVTFGVGGTARLQPETRLTASAATPSGGLVLAGAGGYVTRLDSAGRPDRTFGGGDGVARVSAFPNAAALAVQPDGKILVLTADENGFRNGFVARLNANGTLDTAFGGRGDGVTAVPGGILDSAILAAPDGKIVVTGTVQDVGFGYAAAVARLRADGRPDTSFGGGDGLFVTPRDLFEQSFGASATATADGKLLVAVSNADSEDFGVAVLLLRGDGTLDRSFGGGDGAGSMTRPGGFGFIGDIAIDSTGRPVVATVLGSHGSVAPVRFTVDGKPDWIFTPLTLGGDMYLSRMGIGPDDRVVLAGSATFFGNLDGGQFLCRYRTDGTLDPKFAGGLAFEQIAPGFDVSTIMPDGRAIAVAIDGGLVTRYDYADTPDRSRISFAAGTVKVLGTEQANQINLFSLAGTWRGDVVGVVSDGIQCAFSRATVKRVVVQAGGGDDIVFAQGFLTPLDVHGGDGNDDLRGGIAADRIDGGAGDDYVDASWDEDSSRGDFLLGGPGNDVLVGNNGNDHLEGGAGRDELLGRDGNDRLFGDDGDDVLSGAAGDDWLDGGSGGDELGGGPGSDTLDYTARTAALMVDLADFQASDGAAGERDNAYADLEIVRSGSANDIIRGSSINNTFYGNGGDDILDGRGGNDVLVGGSGSDRLIGGAGNDQLYTRGDGMADWLNGGPGSDSAARDDKDAVLGIEKFI